ncbi:MAG: hypothetical protein DMF26_08375 [Verrucomicrobia bacterium]|nr:MAG: hypothetical protein DMF26_08375 [Verrucomicrobiota bacterium]
MLDKTARFLRSSAHMKMTTLQLRNSGNRLHLRLALLLIPLAYVPLAAQAQTCQQGCLGNFNTVLGDDALLNNTTGKHNTAVGFDALLNNNADNNTAIGYNVLVSNTTGDSNTAIGFQALLGNTTGSANTANGAWALFENTTGNFNTATGDEALLLNTTGNDNTANGFQALFSNTTGNSNTANGLEALLRNTTGNQNTAMGSSALSSNTTGSNNTANGFLALNKNKTGSENTAIGRNALFNNKTGASNIALGNNAGFKTTGSQNIDIGNGGVADESATIRIGTGNQTNTYIAGISGATVPGGIGVIVDSSGHLGTTTSSARFKDAIKPMDKASEAILALKPVTFRYKKELDPEGIPQFGLVAEEVEKVNPDLVAHDADGKAYTVRYEAVNAMLLNEFLKEHRKIQELEANAARQQKQIEALTAGLQKVSAQIEASKTAPQTVLNDQ